MREGLAAIVLTAALFCFLDGYGNEFFWWQEVLCVTPKLPTALYQRANKESEKVAQVRPGDRLPVVYGKEKFILLSDGQLVKERWYEIILVAKTTQAVYGWIKVSETEKCQGQNGEFR